MQTYKKLFTYWYALIIYDLTVEFCERWIRSWKLREQMTGAARSGKQNIVEGSEGMKTSLKTGIKLTNVAKASIEELLADFEDFLRQRGLARWPKDDPRVVLFRRKAAKLVRNLSNLSDLSNLRASPEARQADLRASPEARQADLRASPEARQLKLLKQLNLPSDTEKAANLLLTLCHQATYLLNRQVEALEKKHRTEGGYTEKLYRQRVKLRGH